MTGSQHAVAVLSLVSVAAAEFFIGKIAEETLFIQPPDYFEDEPLFRFKPCLQISIIYPPLGGTTDKYFFSTFQCSSDTAIVVQKDGRAKYGPWHNADQKRETSGGHR